MGFAIIRSVRADTETEKTHPNYLQHYFFKLDFFPIDGIGYRRLLWYIVVAECMIEVSDETTNSRAFNKTKGLEMVESK
jgi:hypothetical protein